MGLLCELLDLQRSSFYYTSKAVDDSHLRLAIEEICLKQTRYGYRRITDRLNRRGIDVGEETVRHLMREMNLLVRPLRRKIQTTQSKKGKSLYPNLIKNLEVVRPNQVWCSDITFIPLSKGKTAYLDQREHLDRKLRFQSRARIRNRTKTFDSARTQAK